jgi:F-type H+-transporting ATPase subunit delta
MLRPISHYVSNAAISRGAGLPAAPTISNSRRNSKGLHEGCAHGPVAGPAEIIPRNTNREHETGARQTHASRENADLAGEETIVSGVAGRYATALFDLARDENAIDAVKADLERFDGLLAESPDLTRLVRSPVFSSEEQLHALSAVLARAGIAGLAENFLKLVTANRRLFAVRDMIKGFRELVADDKGEATAEVTVAEPLKDDHAAALKSALKAVSGKDIDLNVKVDPAIIGGLVVKLGSRMVDTSLRTKLNAIRHAMKEAR